MLLPLGVVMCWCGLPGNAKTPQDPMPVALLPRVREVKLAGKRPRQYGLAEVNQVMDPETTDHLDQLLSA
jgi:hypothetical protein